MSSVVLLAYANAAFAYIGPGMGGGVIAAVLGVLGSIFLAIFAVVYYPIKRAINRKKKSKEASNVDRERVNEEKDQDD